MTRPAFLATPPQPAALLPHAVNHLLAQEPWAREKLKPNAGKTALFVVEPFSVCLAVTDDGFVELADDSEPSVRIELPLSTLPRAFAQMLVRDDSRSAPPRQIKLEGDAEFAQTISFLVQNLRWEAEEDLAKLIGDAAAHVFAGGARSFVTQLQISNRKLADNVAEYLLDENPQLVRPRDVDAFAQSIRTLRDDVARLEKRIERLLMPVRPR